MTQTFRQTLPKEKQPEVAVTQTTPIQVEGPPSSRLRSKTNKNRSTRSTRSPGSTGTQSCTSGPTERNPRG